MLQWCVPIAGVYFFFIWNYHEFMFCVWCTYMSIYHILMNISTVTDLIKWRMVEHHAWYVMKYFSFFLSWTYPSKIACVLRETEACKASYMVSAFCTITCILIISTLSLFTNSQSFVSSYSLVEWLLQVLSCSKHT